MDNKLKIWIVLGLIFACSFGCVSFGNMADGCATDSIARISHGGWIWKTWRLELTNDHPIGDGSGGTIAQRYGIENDDNLIADLQRYADSGERVRICYNSKFFVWDWEYSDAEVVYSVSPVK